MMSYVFIAAIIILSVMLYIMLGKAEKTYAYTRTMTISYKPDGSEQINRIEESGIIFIADKTLTIDAAQYIYKAFDKKKIQARLNYEAGSIKSVTLTLPNGGEKFYYVEKIRSVKDIVRK